MSSYYGQPQPGQGWQNPAQPNNPNNNVYSNQAQGAIQRLGPAARASSQNYGNANRNMGVLDQPNN
jgi:hypothetical protein